MTRLLQFERVMLIVMVLLFYLGHLLWQIILHSMQMYMNVEIVKLIGFLNFYYSFYKAILTALSCMF